MTSDRMTHFAGLPVVDFPFVLGAPLPEVEPDAVAWRLRADAGWDRNRENPDVSVNELFTSFFERVDPARVRAIVTGASYSNGEYFWDYAADALIENARRLPNLRALFLGEVVFGETDMAYIYFGDQTPVLRALPELEEFHVRGSVEQHLDAAVAAHSLSHQSLRKLVFESGGLSPALIRAVGRWELPALEHLEFYLGDENYGGDARVEDLAWLLDDNPFPRLRHLGLRDAPHADDIAAALSGSPVVARLESLDLSLGALGDEGAAALLAGQPLTHLARLDVHFHFMSDAMMERLREALPGVELDLGDRQEEEMEDWGDGEQPRRYIAVSE